MAAMLLLDVPCGFRRAKLGFWKPTLVEFVSI
jgi:hypothetical protein